MCVCACARLCVCVRERERERGGASSLFAFVSMCVSKFVILNCSVQFRRDMMHAVDRTLKTNYLSISSSIVFVGR